MSIASSNIFEFGNIPNLLTFDHQPPWIQLVYFQRGLPSVPCSVSHFVSKFFSPSYSTGLFQFSIKPYIKVVTQSMKLNGGELWMVECVPVFYYLILHQISHCKWGFKLNLFACISFLGSMLPQYMALSVMLPYVCQKNF